MFPALAGNGEVLILGSAGRVEIVTFDHPRDGQKPGFLTVSFYLKASFVKSEIREVSFFRNWPISRFRRPYPTILTETARISRPENPVFTEEMDLSWDPGIRDYSHLIRC